MRNDVFSFTAVMLCGSFSIHLIYVQTRICERSHLAICRLPFPRLMRFLARDLVGFTFLLNLLQEFLDEFLLVFASSVDWG